ncbi:hypothetical protein [Neogemmobacter tilapiae]|uniref:Uncharacterized protein n=1 Tax=Neogemmobacter tilapiae TaxID=875041 RepID=A0A918WHC1_9RHOB|nr:hypothetical protein [Gemmobacter tilapiae]GHC46366.1 hypothetical protein GCM10007315_05060 [Gemmobacter tilapiae]
MLARTTPRQRIQAGPAPVRGMALQRLNEALYAAQCILDLIKALTAPKRQPAGTGRRWPLRLRRVPGPEDARPWK